MDLRGMGLTLRRRWLLSLTALSLAVVVAAAVALRIGSSYALSATGVLVPPQSIITQAQQAAPYAPNNPLLYMGGLGQARDALLRALDGQDTGDAIKERFRGVTVDIAGDPTSSAPMVLVTTTSGSEDTSREALDFIKQRVLTLLGQVQDQLGVKAQDRITLLYLATDTHGQADHKKQIQMSGAAGLGVGFLLLLLIVLVDSWRMARRSPEAATTAQLETARRA